jgi:hypothetical protein
MISVTTTHTRGVRRDLPRHMDGFFCSEGTGIRGTQQST